MLAAAGGVSRALAGGLDDAVCARAVARPEAALAIPRQLLDAISVAETGRLAAERGEILAWPWTVYALGKGRYLPTNTNRPRV